MTVVATRMLISPSLEALHDGFLFVGGEAAVQQADVEIGEDLAREVLVHLLRGFHGLRFGLFDDRIDDVGLAACVDLRFTKL